MLPRPKIPSREDVVEQCLKDNKHNGGFAYNEHVWIKYGISVTLAEADIQRYVREHADHSIVYIPEVFDVFKAHNPYREREITIIVMEFIKGQDCTSLLKRRSTSPPTPTEEEKKIFEAIAKAIDHIWRIPLPKNAKIGPLSGGDHIGGFFGPSFKKNTFDNLHELESWINVMLKKARSKKQISLAEEPLCICHCDPHAANIMLGESITFIDWGCSGIYPKCLDEWAIFNLRYTDFMVFGRTLYKQVFGYETVQHEERMLTLARAALYIDIGQ